MFAFLPVVAVLLAPLASGFTISDPNADGWLGNTTVTLAWDYTNNDPSTFTVELGNPAINSGLLGQGPIAIANNVDTYSRTIQVALPVLPPSDSYFLRFVSPSSINDVYVTSSPFPILANPNSSTAPPSSTPHGSGSSSHHPASKTSSHNATSSSGTSTGTSSGTITSTPSSSGYTSLAVTTLTTSTTSSKHSGATRMEVAWYVGAVGVFLGAIFA